MKHYFESDVHHHSENGSETRISKSREQMLWEAALAALPTMTHWLWENEKESMIAESAFNMAEAMVQEFERRVSNG